MVRWGDPDLTVLGSALGASEVVSFALAAIQNEDVLDGQRESGGRWGPILRGPWQHSNTWPVARARADARRGCGSTTLSGRGRSPPPLSDSLTLFRVWFAFPISLLIAFLRVPNTFAWFGSFCESSLSLSVQLLGVLFLGELDCDND